jgi:hypothetical protein
MVWKLMTRWAPHLQRSANRWALPHIREAFNERLSLLSDEVVRNIVAAIDGTRAAHPFTVLDHTTGERKIKPPTPAA